MKCLTDNFLTDLMNTVRAAVHIKDTKTGKYLQSNSTNSRTFSLTPSDIVGLTVYDLNSIMYGYWDDNFIPEIIKLEEEVKKHKVCMSHQKAFLTKENRIRLQNMVKIPIHNGNKVEQIFTISEDVVSSLDLNQLWKLHKESYLANTRMKIKNFLAQINVANLFNELPTESELLIIIANIMHKNPGSKSIAQCLHISPRTVEVHNTHINEKLNCNKSILFAQAVVINGN